MSRDALKPGTAFRATNVKDDIFVFVQPCSLIEGDGLFRRFNMKAGFIEPNWYRFKMDANHLQQTRECDFVG
ncbi:hypothetical protein [Nitrospira sp. M1]